jgi:nitroreductase
MTNSILKAPHARPAPADHPVHELLAMRWSPRAFDTAAIGAAELASLLEAARWAPSASNEQPWSFLVAQRAEQEGFARLLACLNPNNQAWAGRAAVLMIGVARMTLSTKPQPNRHALYDLGQAVACMSVQATALGLAVHQMAGFDAARARNDCAVPEGCDPVIAIAVGRPGDPLLLPEALQVREAVPRVRKPVGEFVFGAAWGAAQARGAA